MSTMRPWCPQFRHWEVLCSCTFFAFFAGAAGNRNRESGVQERIVRVLASREIALFSLLELSDDELNL